MLDIVLGNIEKVTGIEKFHDTKILIDTDGKFQKMMVTFKNILRKKHCLLSETSEKMVELALSGRELISTDKD